MATTTPISGKLMKIQVSADGTTWTDVKGMDNARMALGRENIDITEFGDGWAKRLRGVKDNSFNLSGNYIPDDPGQKMIRSALVNDTDLHVKYLYDGVDGFSQQVEVASFEPAATAKGKAELNIQMDGNGALSVIDQP
jgi:predicted secreted protein